MERKISSLLVFRLRDLFVTARNFIAAKAILLPSFRGIVSRAHNLVSIGSALL
jgi:hypothetical protein